MPTGAVADVSGFLRWWGRELAGLVPRRATAGFSATGRGARTVVSFARGTLAVIEERGRTSRTLASVAVGPGVALAEALASVDRLGLRGPVGIRVAREACFTRSLLIPEAAADDAAALAALDLERATPFRAADVLTAVLPDPGAVAPKGRIAVRQLVLKRETVRPLLDALATRGLEAGFIDCWNEDGKAALPVDFLAATTADKGQRRGRHGARRLLAVAAFAGAIAAALVTVVRHDHALDALEGETAAVRRGAGALSQRITQAEMALAGVARLADLRGRRPAAVSIIDEITRLLPDSAYLTELTLDGDQVDMTGYAKAAAPLIEVFEKSVMFADARFSAPSRLDTREDLERFAIRIRLRTSSGLDGRDTASPVQPIPKG